jgi:hypothetical protein
MSRLRTCRLFCIFLIILTAFSSSIRFGQATVASFTARAGEETTRPLSLAIEDRVAIKFAVVGGQGGSTLDFWITCPNGTDKAIYIDVGNLDYRFVCDAEGNYTMHFSNAGSFEDMFVSLDYEVQHYIFGMPQMLFLTMIVVVVCVAAVAVFILMGKPR